MLEINFIENVPRNERFFTDLFENLNLLFFILDLSSENKTRFRCDMSPKLLMRTSIQRVIERMSKINSIHMKKIRSIYIEFITLTGVVCFSCSRKTLCIYLLELMRWIFGFLMIVYCLEKEQ